MKSLSLVKPEMLSSAHSFFIRVETKKSFQDPLLAKNEKKTLSGNKRPMTALHKPIPIVIFDTNKPFHTHNKISLKDSRNLFKVHSYSYPMKKKKNCIKFYKTATQQLLSNLKIRSETNALKMDFCLKGSVKLLQAPSRNKRDTRTIFRKYQIPLLKLRIDRCYSKCNFGMTMKDLLLPFGTTKNYDKIKRKSRLFSN